MTNLTTSSVVIPTCEELKRKEKKALRVLKSSLKMHVLYPRSALEFWTIPERPSYDMQNNVSRILGGFTQCVSV